MLRECRASVPNTRKTEKKNVQYFVARTNRIDKNVFPSSRTTSTARRTSDTVLRHNIILPRVSAARTVLVQFLATGCV